MSTPSKICRKCGKEFTYDQLKRNRNASGGVEAICWPCSRARTRAWYWRNTKAHNDKNKMWRTENRERRKIYERERNRLPKRRALHKPMQAKWRRNNADKILIAKHRRRSLLRRLPATFKDMDWENCLIYWQDCCAYCGRPRGLWHTLCQEHFIPVVQGGAYTADNILPACHGIYGCNNQKGDSGPHAWLEKRFGKSKAKTTLDKIERYFEWIAQQK